MTALTVSSASLGGPVAAPFEIGTWQGFRPAAISYTFDDDLPNQYSVAVPMFNAEGFKLTLFTVTTWLPGGSWTPVKTAALFGHEIASHTVSHPSLGGLPASQQTNELRNSQAAINTNVTNQLCLTLAYPNCVEANAAITARYYIAARICSGQIVPKTPANFLTISSFVCGSQGSVRTVQDFNNVANNALTAKGWAVYLIHALDNDSGYSPLSSAVLQGSLNYMNTNRDKFWVETFGNVVRYIRERDATSVTVISNAGDRIIIQATNNLDRAIYDHPITLRRPMPTNWAAATVTQNGKQVDAQTVLVNSNKSIQFDLVPNGGDVTLSAVVPPILSLAPLTLECTDGTASGAVDLWVRDSSGHPVEVVWTVDGVPFQTNNIVPAGTLTETNLTLATDFASGEHVIVVSASNGLASSATNSTTVTVGDTVPPRILDISVTPKALWPPDHRMVTVSVSVEAVDDCDPSPVARITQVASNQPQNPFAPDWEITGSLMVTLRAERLGNWGDRIYSLFVEVTDSSGNKSSDKILVAVPHSQSGGSSERRKP